MLRLTRHKNKMCITVCFENLKFICYIFLNKNFKGKMFVYRIYDTCHKIKYIQK